MKVGKIIASDILNLFSSRIDSIVFYDSANSVEVASTANIDVSILDDTTNMKYVLQVVAHLNLSSSVNFDVVILQDVDGNLVLKDTLNSQNTLPAGSIDYVYSLEVAYE